MQGPKFIIVSIFKKLIVALQVAKKKEKKGIRSCLTVFFEFSENCFLNLKIVFEEKNYFLKIVIKHVFLIFNF